MMDNDMESLSLYYLDHRRELRGVIKYKTPNFSFPPKFFFAPWAITLSYTSENSILVNWGGDYEKP
jgi:hypothetical protein